MVWATSHKVCVAAISAMLVSGAAYAERVETGAPEFPRETEALVAATVSLFEAAEAQSQPAPSTQLTLTPRATPVSAPSGAV